MASPGTSSCVTRVLAQPVSRKIPSTGLPLCHQSPGAARVQQNPVHWFACDRARSGKPSSRRVWAAVERWLDWARRCNVTLAATGVMRLSIVRHTVPPWGRGGGRWGFVYVAVLNAPLIGHIDHVLPPPIPSLVGGKRVELFY